MKKLSKLSNRGSTFVIVITTIGFVGIVTSLVLMVTSAGYQSKAVDNQAKNNFYSAEEIVDQVKTGLHNDMSKAIMSAYFSTLTAYRDVYIATEDRTGEAWDEWKKNVYREYKKAAIGDTTKGFIKTITNSGATVDNKIDSTVLQGYISQDYISTKDHVNIEVGIQKNNEESSVMTYEYDPSTCDSITLKNIGVRYTNQYGYTNSIFTDIVMRVPEISFDFLDLDKNTMFTEYALMSASDVNYSSDIRNSGAIVGNFWVGNDFNVKKASRVQALSDYGYIGGKLHLSVADSTPTLDSRYMFEMNVLGNGNSYSHLFQHGSGNYNPRSVLSSVRSKPGNLAYELDGSRQYITRLDASSTPIKKISFEDSYFAVGDIEFDGVNKTSTVNVLNSDANLYVKNDMQFNVDNARADIFNLYKGYGFSSDDPNTASSIILNNKFCKLNMNLRILSIMDNASIKTNAVDDNIYSAPFASKDVRTGDSLIVRGNQIAYLVPSANVPTFHTNPVSTSEATTQGIDLKNFASTIAAGLPDAIKNLCVTGEEVRPIFYSYTGNSGDYVAYYYLNFKTPEDAVTYYDSLENNGERVVTDTMKETLLGLIPAEINVNYWDLNSSKLRGHVITKLNAGVNGLIEDPATHEKYKMADRYEWATDDGNATNKEVMRIRSFLQIKTPRGIKDKGLEDSYLGKTAIENIIDWNEIHDASRRISNNTIINDTRIYDSVRLTVMVVDGDINLNNSANYKGLFIATGDINIGSGTKVEGLCIAGYNNRGDSGKITVGTNSVLKANSEYIGNIYRDAAQFRITTPTGPIFFNEIFRGYEHDSTAHTYVDLLTTEGCVINLNNMFSYENWSRQ